MFTIRDLVGIHKDSHVCIIGAGSSLRIYNDYIKDFLVKNNPIIIGINNMTSFWTPKYHLWTNTQRFRTYSEKIQYESTLLLGSNIPLKIIQEHIGNREYGLINYEDKSGNLIGYKNGKIRGYYRTAGCLAIMIAHLMGASEISVVGMDGYTLYNNTDLVDGKESQHCYGYGLTDTADWETCVSKDGLIYNVLKSLKTYGIDFKIITPTKYEEFYDSIRLYR